jgi:nucleoside-diphosphate-sugar epimerase
LYSPPESIISSIGSTGTGSEEPRQQRRSQSFADAEDIMNGSGHGGFQQQQQNYKEETYSPPPNGLHHRATTTTTRTTPNANMDYSYPSNHNQPQHELEQHNHRPAIYPTSYLPVRRNYHHHSHPTILSTRKKRTRRWLCLRWFNWCLTLGFATYIMFVVRGYFWLQQNPTRPTGPYAALFPRHSSSSSFVTKTSVLKRQSESQITQRATYRKQRTQSVPQPQLQAAAAAAGQSSISSIPWYALLQMDQHAREERHSSPNIMSTPQKTATLDQLCGYDAQNASMNHPDSFPAMRALNADARVLITGILTPLGFHLALHLAKRCGVEVIAGMDAMWPNTVENRLKLQERIAILTTNIPRLVKPIGLPYVGLDLKNNKKNGAPLLESGEFNLMYFQPTHIVHLASASYDDFTSSYSHQIKDEWKNTNSPYVSEDYDPPLYQLRSSMASMEQLLESLATADEDDRPHFLYASASTASAAAGLGNKTNATRNLLHSTNKLIDEVLSDTYYAQTGVTSVGLRLPNAIYGSWSQPGTTIHDLMDTAARHWNANATGNGTGTTLSLVDDQKDEMLDLVHVDDAVDAIVAAMQYHTTKPIVMDISSGIDTSASSVAAIVRSFFSNAHDYSNSKSKPLLQNNNPILQQHQNNAQAANNVLRPLEWTPRTLLNDGMLNTFAWHLDRLAPYTNDPNTTETGDALLKRHGIKTCAADDVACHKGRPYLPCLSECNTKDHCVPSIFDPVLELMRTVTEGCDVVLYMQSLGYNVGDLKLHSEYMDEAEIVDETQIICNFVFVPRESDVVNMVTNKVPNDQLSRFGVFPLASDVGQPHALHERKLKELNGRLLYHGWILIWIENALEELSVTDKSLLKMSPGKLFHKEVKRALFVEENFSVSPNIDDVQFLVGEMTRGAFEKRAVRKDILVPMPNGGERTKSVKYRLPSEPQRRAAILFAPLRYPNIEGQQLFDPRKKLSVHDASKLMRYEIDLDPNDKEPADIRRQREYYERIPSYMNCNELRSNFEPWYRYSMRHWVRTRWVVHDMELEESRLLRCEWYHEHVQWGTDLDQLSFAHVMAKRELERRMAHEEPDDHVKTFIKTHPELHDFTDAHEWHAMETEQNRLYREPTKWLAQLPDHVDKAIWEEKYGQTEDRLMSSLENRAPIFVRIMSEKIMAVSRKAWSKAHKKKKE